MSIKTMRVNPRAFVDASVASGRIMPSRHEYWRAKIAVGGRAGADAIMELLSLAPVGRRNPVAASAGQLSAEDQLYQSIWPQAAAEPPAHEVHDRTGGVMPANEADHPKHGQAYGFHEHVHADGQGGQHSHLHEHQGDANHQTSGVTAHVHDTAAAGLRLCDPVSAGIAARMAERGQARRGGSDRATYDGLYGPGAYS